MLNKRSYKLGITTACVALCVGFGGIADAAVNYFTCVGGASGMTLQLNPFAAGGVQQGCASKMMITTLKQKNMPSGTGTVKCVYTAARMKASDAAWSEPNSGWGTGQFKFTGDKSQCEIEYIKLSNGDYLYALIIRADSVQGLRFVLNRQFIYDFTALSGTKIFADSTGADMTNPVEETDPDWFAVKSAIMARLPANGGSGIPIEGGLTECYIDSGVRAIDAYNRQFPGAKLQPQLNPANYTTTKDNPLSVAVLGIIYSADVQTLNGGEPVNFTTQMERLITGGMVDNWDFFLKDQHLPLLNYYREPLSGTAVTYQSLLMRGVPLAPNGTIRDGLPLADANDPLPGYNYHRSGIPDLTCLASPTASNSPFKPGGGAMNNAVDRNPGAHGYTFLQKFQPVASPALNNIRVAKFNGYEPYDFSLGNSLPGFGGVPDVDLNVVDPYYQNVIDGKYPLWTYNHCFDVTNGASTNLADFVANFRVAGNAPYVRAVGLIPLDDMNTKSMTKTVSPTGPNAGRGQGYGRCGYVSPITGEIVRDGMMFMLNDSSTVDGLPGEGYVEMRP